MLRRSLLGAALVAAATALLPLQPSEDTTPLKRLVVLGSSTAEGAGPRDINDSWVNLVRVRLRAMEPPIEVINLGRGGYTTYHLLPTGSDVREGRPTPDVGRNVTEAILLNADAVIVNLPSNDVASGFSLDEQIANDRAILGALAEAGIPTWLATTQPRNLPAERAALQFAMKERTQALAEEFEGAAALDFWTGLAREDHGVAKDVDSGDGVHLNADGHGLLARRVLDSGVLAALGKD